MILCPNCHHQELPGALFCSECGAQLISVEHLTTQSINRTPSDALDVSLSQSIQETPATVASAGGDAVVSLHLMESGKIIHLVGRSEYTLGRVTEGQPIVPDVDLSQQDAYSQGVSRLHASLRISQNRVSVFDLGSSNGTRVNGQKIVPHVDYPLSHGDIISLGKFKIQILIHY